MISGGELKRAVQQSLSALGSIKDVREVEVFASSTTQLLTRLNYTSHLPCNGVEEPKSFFAFGIGVRAVFRTRDKTEIGFGSEPGDLTVEGARRALAKARQGAVVDPEFVSLPTPTGERRTLKRHHDPPLMNLRDMDLVRVGWKVIREGFRIFHTSRLLATHARGKRQVPSLGLILGGDVTIIQERMAIASTRLPEVRLDESTVILAFLTAMVERLQAKGSGWSAGTRLADFTGAAGAQAARAAIASAGGQRVPPGTYRVVLGPQAMTDLMIHLILPGLTASTFYAGSSPFQGRLFQRVASEQLTIYDHGAARGLAASKGITCEGLPTGRTDLLKAGVLVGLLSNDYESRRLLNDPRGKEKLGLEPSLARKALIPRNGFRSGEGGGRHFDTSPGIGATNVILEGARTHTARQLFQLVGDGLYIGRLWYTYPINGLAAGDFTCTVIGDSYIITDGKLTAPLQPNTVRINDNILKILNQILGVGRERKGTFGWGGHEIVYTPEIAVEGVRITEIAEPGDQC